MPFVNNTLVQTGTNWVTGVQAPKLGNTESSQIGVPNPYGRGASAYEPNTILYDPSNDPLMQGSSQQLSGVDAIEREREKEAAAAEAATANTGGSNGGVSEGAIAGSVPYASLFTAAGAKYGVPAALLAAVARAESNFNPNARSPVGAQGLMQFMPATARGLGVNPLDPNSAIDGAARFLSGLYKQFGRWDYALAAYNAGPGAVHKYGGIPPYAETQHYVNAVTQYEQQYSVGVTAGQTANTPGAQGSVLNFINAAKTLLGKPYVWGGTTANGVDCSGLLYYAFNQAGIKMPRYVASQYGKMGTQVGAQDARPGDVVYWDEPGSVDHVGIYLGNGLVLNSPHSGTVVQIDRVWGNPVYRRIIQDNNFQQMATPNAGSPVLAYNGQNANHLFTGPTPQNVPIGIGIQTTTPALEERTPTTGFKIRAI